MHYYIDSVMLLAMTHAPVTKNPKVLINTSETKDTLANVGNKVGYEHCMCMLCRKKD
jgi:hypothetical protein